MTNAKKLYFIDGHQLPELSREQQGRFMDDPLRYLIRASDDHAAAIFRELQK